MTKVYIVKISPVVTLYFPLVENIQSSFCTPRGVLVLVFASQADKVLFWQRRKSFICSVIAEKVMRNGNIWHISVTKLRLCQLQALTTVRTLCFVLISQFLLPIEFSWNGLAQTEKLSYIFLIEQFAHFKGKSDMKLSKLILNWTVKNNSYAYQFGLTTS